MFLASQCDGRIIRSVRTLTNNKFARSGPTQKVPREHW